MKIHKNHISPAPSRSGGPRGNPSLRVGAVRAKPATIAGISCGPCHFCNSSVMTRQSAECPMADNMVAAHRMRTWQCKLDRTSERTCAFVPCGMDVHTASERKRHRVGRRIGPRSGLASIRRFLSGAHERMSELRPRRWHAGSPRQHSISMRRPESARATRRINGI